MANLGSNDNIRLGLSYKQYEADLDSVRVSGSIVVGSTTYSDSGGSYSNEDFKTVGLDFDNKVRLYSVNAYYDFKPDGALTPYLGVGIGFADIENAKSDEFTLNLSAGFNYALTEHYYWGVKGDYHRVSGPKDKLGLNYETIHAYSVMAALGYRF